jgi:hypothetical protein
MLRLLVVGALALALMAAIKDGRLPRTVGLTASCVAAVAPPAPADPERPYWIGCRAGKLTGRADFSGSQCTSAGLVGGLEYWRCPAPLGSLRGA